jgi:hypothetical protein
VDTGSPLGNAAKQKPERCSVSFEAEQCSETTAIRSTCENQQLMLRCNILMRSVCIEPQPLVKTQKNEEP